MALNHEQWPSSLQDMSLRELIPLCLSSWVPGDPGTIHTSKSSANGLKNIFYGNPVETSFAKLTKTWFLLFIFALFRGKMAWNYDLHTPEGICDMPHWGYSLNRNVRYGPRDMADAHGATNRHAYCSIKTVLIEMFKHTQTNQSWREVKTTHIWAEMRCYWCFENWRVARNPQSVQADVNRTLKGRGPYLLKRLECLDVWLCIIAY